MSVSTLANTSWIFNNSLGQINITRNFHVNAYSGPGFYNGFQAEFSSLIIQGNSQEIDYDYTIVYRNGEWVSQQDRVITFLSGTDIADSDLIAYMEANATQVPITDLTNTTWRINSLTCTAGYKQLSLTYETNDPDKTGSSIWLGYAASGMFPEQITSAQANSVLLQYYTDGNPGYTNLNINDEIYIIGSTDIFNPDAILWFAQNATLIPNNNVRLYSGNFDVHWTINEQYIYGNVQIFKPNDLVRYGSTSPTSLAYSVLTFSLFDQSGTLITDSYITDNENKTSSDEFELPSGTKYMILTNMSGNTIVSNDYYLGHMHVLGLTYSISVQVNHLTYTGSSTITDTATITLVPDSGYSLPSSITVSGASYTYNSTTGVISLSNPVENVIIIASGIPVITFDLSTLGLSTGTHTITVIAEAAGYLDSDPSNSVSYTVLPQLNTPTISLSGDTLSIEEVENAEYYDIYVDGVLEESVPAVDGYSGNILTSLFIPPASNPVPFQYMETYIKFDTPPVDENDYDAFVNGSGIANGLSSFTNKTKVYVWGSQIGKIRINGVDINGGYTYENYQEVTLTGDYDIYMYYYSYGQQPEPEPGPYPYES